MMFYDRDSGGQIQMLVPSHPDRAFAWRWPVAIVFVLGLLLLGTLGGCAEQTPESMERARRAMSRIDFDFSQPAPAYAGPRVLYCAGRPVMYCN